MKEALLLFVVVVFVKWKSRENKKKMPLVLGDEESLNLK